MYTELWYLTLIVSQLTLIAKHFIPPIAVNAFLGTVLWATYAESSSFLEPHIGNSPTLLAAASGAIAGGSQAFIAAPAENVRIIIEGGTKGGWTHAWKEVFRGTVPASPAPTKEENLREIRQVREWMKEVRGMAGRGWDGWGFGVVKDIFGSDIHVRCCTTLKLLSLGFSVFFSIFEITRRSAVSAKLQSKELIQAFKFGDDGGAGVRRHTPRVVHALTLVTGGAIAGLAYEMVSRPLDIARRAVYLDKVNTNGYHSVTKTLLHQVKDEGIFSFFVDPAAQLRDSTVPVSRPKLYAFLRTLGRVGPWGCGFLVWEAVGPGLA